LKVDAAHDKASKKNILNAVDPNPIQNFPASLPPPLPSSIVETTCSLSGPAQPTIQPGDAPTAQRAQVTRNEEELEPQEMEAWVRALKCDDTHRRRRS